MTKTCHLRYRTLYVRSETDVTVHELRQDVAFGWYWRFTASLDHEAFDLTFPGAVFTKDRPKAEDVAAQTDRLTFDIKKHRRTA